MLRKSRIVTLIGLIGISALISCNSGGATGSGNGVVVMPDQERYSYTVSNDTLYITMPGGITYHCQGLNLVPVDTSYPFTLPIAFVLQGNSLTVYAESDVAPSGAVVQYGWIATGFGGGGGLQGTWTISDFTVR